MRRVPRRISRKPRPPKLNKHILNLLRVSQLVEHGVVHMINMNIPRRWEIRALHAMRSGDCDPLVFATCRRDPDGEAGYLARLVAGEEVRREFAGGLLAGVDEA